MLNKYFKNSFTFSSICYTMCSLGGEFMILGDLIKAYRNEHDMSMDDFSKITGLSKAYISMIEKNINPRNNKPIVPTLETFAKVSKAMNMELNELLKLLDTEQLVYISPEQTELEKEYTSVLTLYSSLNRKNRDESIKYMTYLKNTDNDCELAEESVPYIIDNTVRLLGQTAAGTPIEYADEGCFTESVS